MRILFWLSLLASLAAHGQCLTDFSKLTPESAPDYSLDFGRSISMYGDYLAVGVPNSDSVGRITGLVHIYKKQGTQWIKHSSIVPAVPIDAIQFGWSVKMSQDYLFVGAYGQGGSVYVYKKNGTDWTTPVQLAIWKVPDGQRFGTSANNPIGITDDQNTVVITDIWHLDSSFPNGSSGAMYLYHKNAGNEWSNSSSRTLIPPPEADVDDFGDGGVQFQGSRMATFVRFAPTANGQIYVYKDNSGTFSNYQLEAKLAAGDLHYSYGFGNDNFAFTEDGIFTLASVDVETANPKWEVVFFEQPQTGPWPDRYLTCHFDPNTSTDKSYWIPNVFAAVGNDLFLTSRDEDGTGFLTRLRKGAGGWCNPVYETIEENLPNPGTAQRFGTVIAANQNLDVVVGYVAPPNVGITQVALKTYTRSGSTWQTGYLYAAKKSTAAHYYGTKILGQGDNLFVTAPYDGTVKANAGAVYVYTKSGGAWTKTAKILPPAGGRYDDVFGSNMAISGDYLAVAAAGHSPAGKFFVYRKGTDWSNPSLVQEIVLANDGLIVYTSGDNIAMSKDWLVMPYMDSGSSGGMAECHIFLALYKFDGTEFKFHQSMCLQGTDFFARSSTVPVSIEGNLIVAGTKILELNEEGNWEVKCVLSQTDSEPIQISSDFKSWVSNGDKFGYSNYISNGTIFISAPTRDYNGTWDVGAVYVYTKLPNEEWTSRTESAKIIPNTKEESGLFGYSMAAFQNTLIVGSPINDQYKSGQVINKPGLASVFQAKDYHWTNTQWIADFTGDSFIKDYFGMAVHIDETDFFMGAPVEDLETGKISGSVYVVPTPPIVKLVPPVCATNETVELLGYPFEGTWSGPGITDPQGLFDPSSVGPGKYILTYRTPNCANAGLLEIHVADDPLTVFADGTDHFVCANANPIAVLLQVEPKANVSYEWYYRETSNGVFKSLDVLSSELTATKRGEYQVNANNGICSAFSPVINVRNEQIELTLDTVATSCNNSGTSIALKATPAGGAWSGTGVTSNSFSPRQSPGEYLLTYKYNSPLGCQYNKTTLAKVIAPYKPALSTSGNICLTGEATVSLTNAPPDLATITWLKKEPTETEYGIAQNGGNAVTIQSNGVVKVVAQTTYCLPEEKSIVINDSFKANVSPSAAELEFCPSGEEKLIVQSEAPGISVTWKYYEQSISDVIALSSSDAELKPEKTGYYYASLQLGKCLLETTPQHVLILPADTLFVPNVFTPNGDGKNEVFKMITNDPSASFEVFNRYGESVYADPANTGWNGGDAPAGVYFYYGINANCHSDPRTIKGTVHLIR
ncbi:gliding motility-associated C-terminal domain-containing protein [Chryseolinea sp. T2]|uniref:T9SS type B sorting domain-containing protein n=1 Tax=Chryseolinea sp. T2 TaxID=3129255 RepID=UPI0030785AB3